MKRRTAKVQTSAPEPEIRARVEGTPAPAALESFAAFLLERIQAREPKNNADASRRRLYPVK